MSDFADFRRSAELALTHRQLSWKVENTIPMPFEIEVGGGRPPWTVVFVVLPRMGWRGRITWQPAVVFWKEDGTYIKELEGPKRRIRDDAVVWLQCRAAELRIAEAKPLGDEDEVGPDRGRRHGAAR